MFIFWPRSLRRRGYKHLFSLHIEALTFAGDSWLTRFHYLKRNHFLAAARLFMISVGFSTPFTSGRPSWGSLLWRNSGPWSMTCSLHGTAGVFLASSRRLERSEA